MIVRRAQLVLAAVFAAVTLAMLGLFAGGVYTYAARTFDLDVSTGEHVGPDAAERGLAALRSGMAITFVVLLLIVPVVSYLLAGAALGPVRAAYAREQRLSDDAAHELRTPLSVLQGVLELAVSRERRPAEYRDAIGSALDVVGGLDRLTSQLLMLAHAGDRRAREAFGSVDLRVVAQEAVDRSVTTPGGVRVTVSARGGALAFGSHDLLVAAVANLVRNAVAATPSRGHVAVAVTSGPSHAVVEVRDDGRGMSPQELARATERFWRADTGRGSGHGIGLALVQQIAEVHNGTLGLGSAVDEGTVATLSIPVDGARHRLVTQPFLAWRQPRPGRRRRRSEP